MDEKNKKERCPKCVAEDIENDCGFWKCNYCGHIWDDEKK